MYEIEPYFEAIRPYYLDRDAGHDLRHIARIFDRLEELSVGYNPSPRLHFLHFLAAFHGLGKEMQSDAELQSFTKDFLEQLGWKDDEISQAFAALERHLRSPQTVEEMIVHDANYFEVTGAFGIAKAFTVGGHFNQSYEQTLEIFSENIEKLVFRTPVGRAAYEVRKEIARTYIKEFQNELKIKKLELKLPPSE